MTARLVQGIPTVSWTEEKVYHFSCSDCAKGWDMYDYTPAKHKAIFCPHCGLRQFPKGYGTLI